MTRAPAPHYRYRFQPRRQRPSWLLGTLPFLALVLGMWVVGR